MKEQRATRAGKCDPLHHNDIDAFYCKLKQKVSLANTQPRSNISANHHHTQHTNTQHTHFTIIGPRTALDICILNFSRFLRLSMLAVLYLASLRLANSFLYIYATCIFFCLDRQTLLSHRAAHIFMPKRHTRLQCKEIHDSMYKRGRRRVERRQRDFAKNYNFTQRDLTIAHRGSAESAHHCI